MTQRKFLSTFLTAARWVLDVGVGMLDSKLLFIS